MHNYNAIAAKWFFVGFMLFFVFSALVLAGCTRPLEQVIQKATAEQLTGMQPEQIKAWRDSGMVFWACLQINGPPPAGSGTLLILPASVAQENLVQFGNDCHPIPPPVQPIILNNGQVVTTTKPTTSTTSTTTTTTLPPAVIR